MKKLIGYYDVLLMYKQKLMKNQVKKQQKIQIFRQILQRLIVQNNKLFHNIYKISFKNYMQVLQFPKGNLYMIISKSNEMALKIADMNNKNDSRIVYAQPNPNDISQLFFIERVKNQDFQIINAISDLVFEEVKREVHLRKGKQNSDQLFHLEKVPLSQYYTYYWIKTDQKSKEALCLQGILRYKNFDVNDHSQLFRFQPVTTNLLVNQSSIIVNVKSGKAIDIPGSSSEKGLRLIQYTKNKRFNQRWRFIKVGNSFQIQSLLNGLNLDIAGQEKKPNSKVIQWTPTGNTNQLWTIQSRGYNQYVIRSVHEHSLVLGIKQDSLDDGGKLAIVNFEALWKFEGNIPK